MLSPRETFTALVFSGPLKQADAIVVLTGEDAIPRADTAFQLLKQGAAQVIVLTGNMDDPPAKQDAKRVAAYLMGQGLAPDRIVLESRATQTREQAVNVVAMAVERGWARLLLCVSAYHTPRAYLTFLRALQDIGKAEAIQIVAVPASQSAWFRTPDGVASMTRVQLLDLEFSKIALYGHDVASYDEGISYLKHWEAAA